MGVRRVLAVYSIAFLFILSSCLENPEFEPERDTALGGDVADVVEGRTGFDVRVSDVACGRDGGHTKACDGGEDLCEAGASKPCSLQKGICEGTTSACQDGRFPRCDAATYGPEYESEERSCDQKDNDCDGVIDEVENCRFVSSVGSRGFDTSFDVAAAEDGGFFFTGMASNDIKGANSIGKGDVLLGRSDGGGKVQWVDLFGSSESDTGYEIFVDGGRDSLFIAGTTTGSIDGQINNGELDLFVAKYSLRGEKKWVRLVGSGGLDRDPAIAVDGSSKAVYLTGTVPGSVGGQDHQGPIDGVIAKFDYDGANKWVRLLGAQSGVRLTSAVSWPGLDGLYVAGSHDDSKPNASKTGQDDDPAEVSAPFLARFSSDGDRVWLERFPEIGARDEAASIEEITWDSDLRELYAVGGIGRSSFVTSIESGGKLRWWKELSTSDGKSLGLMDVTAGAARVFVVGLVDGKVGGFEARGGRDALFAAFTSDGVRRNLERFGTPNGEVFYGVAKGAGGTNRIIASGYTSGGLGDISILDTESALFYRLR